MGQAHCTLANDRWLCENNQRGSVTEGRDCKQLEEGQSANNTQSVFTVVHYLCHFLLRGKEVVVGQIHCVHA